MFTIIVSNANMVVFTYAGNSEINYFIIGVFPDSSVGKESAFNEGDHGSIPG